ncbi:MAG TPA: TadE/TadG family type IV pilus assembly protein [Terracidiphilus sp.]|nr:TadE/TadG family type IV pilus assembly protein [Terracidiphilus sp.]
MKRIARLPRLFHREDGGSIAELALLMPLLLLILLGGIDFSRAYFLSIEVAGAAQAGAAYGVLHPTDTTGMSAAATADAPNVSNLTVSTPTYGCECSDGTLSSTSCTSKPTCTYNVVYWISVTASTTYSPVFPWPHIPSSMTLSQTATMRSQSY